MLPVELQHVLHLARNLRHCFVLRLLVGLSRALCAWLLHLETRQIDERTCAAVLELAMVRRGTQQMFKPFRKRLSATKERIT